LWAEVVFAYLDTVFVDRDPGIVDDEQLIQELVLDVLCEGALVEYLEHVSTGYDHVILALVDLPDL
jgi:hypothetical protein